MTFKLGLTEKLYNMEKLKKNMKYDKTNFVFHFLQIGVANKNSPNSIRQAHCF